MRLLVPVYVAKTAASIRHLPTSCITFHPKHALTAQYTTFSDHNHVWVKFTVSEVEPQTRVVLHLRRAVQGDLRSNPQFMQQSGLLHCLVNANVGFVVVRGATIQGVLGLNVV